MRAAAPAVAGALVLAGLAGCATSEGAPHVYRGEAVTTLQSAHSSVETVRIALVTRLGDRVFGRTADDVVSSAETALAGTAGTFTGLQPPAGADRVRDAAEQLLSQAQDAVEAARIAVRRDDRDAMRAAYGEVAKVSAALDHADEELP